MERNVVLVQAAVGGGGSALRDEPKRRLRRTQGEYVTGGSIDEGVAYGWERRTNQTPHDALRLKFRPSHRFSQSRSAWKEHFQSPN